MSGMLRFTSEEAFDAMLKKGNVKIAKPIGGKNTPSERRDAPPQVRPVSAQAAPATGLAGTALPKPDKESAIERRFAQQIRTVGLPDPEREYYHIPGRDFRLDFAWPPQKIAVEVQGMAHRIKGKFNADIEKRALALLAGWTVLEVNGDAVRDERGIGWLVQIFEQRCHR